MLAENTAALKALTAVITAKIDTVDVKRVAASEVAIQEEAARVTKGNSGKAPDKTAPKAMTAEQFAMTWADYLKVDDDSERAERKGQIRKVAEHFGVKKMSEMDKSKYPAALAILKGLQAGETPDFMVEESVI